MRTPVEAQLSTLPSEQAWFTQISMLEAATISPIFIPYPGLEIGRNPACMSRYQKDKDKDLARHWMTSFNSITMESTSARHIPLPHRSLLCFNIEYPSPAG
jgi:hypothetical protein